MFTDLYGLDQHFHQQVKYNDKDVFTRDICVSVSFCFDFVFWKVKEWRQSYTLKTKQANKKTIKIIEILPGLWLCILDCYSISWNWIHNCCNNMKKRGFSTFCNQWCHADLSLHKEWSGKTAKKVTERAARMIFWWSKYIL